MPEGWKIVALGDITADQRIGTVRRGVSGGTTLPLLKMGNLLWGGLDLADIELIDEASAISDGATLKAGDILFNTRNTPELVGKTAYWPAPFNAAFDNNLMRIRLAKEADSRLVAAWMGSPTGQAAIGQFVCASTSVGAVYWRDLSALRVPIPPSNEQPRIAAMLDTWDEAIVTTEHLTKSLICRRGVLTRQAFDASTCTVTLETVGRLEKGRGLAKADVAGIGVPCLRYAEIYTRYGDTARQLASRASPAGVRSSRRLLSGEIVFAASGETAEEIGKAVAYLGDEPAVVGGDTVILTGHNQNAAYLAYALNSPSVVRQKSAAGKGHSVVHIHAADLAKVEIPLPPRDTQDQVAAVFRQADDEIEGRQVAADLLRRQKRGLMQKLLTGQWRVPATGDAFAPGGPAADRLEAAE